MDVEWVRGYCMGLPHTTETVQWGANLVFKIGGKMYAMAELEDADHWLSFKCSPEDFADLCEREDHHTARAVVHRRRGFLQRDGGGNYADPLDRPDHHRRRAAGPHRRAATERILRRD